VRDCRMPKENGQEGKRLRQRIIYHRRPNSGFGFRPRQLRTA
jgi:hypothetical protein